MSLEGEANSTPPGKKNKQNSTPGLTFPRQKSIVLPSDFGGSLLVSRRVGTVRVCAGQRRMVS